MGIKYLWDANTAIYYLQQHFPPKAEQFMDESLQEGPPCISIIAATALVYGLVLITRNTKDFGLVSELQVFDPHSL